MKITKEQIIEGAKFELSIGTVEIISIVKDGYKKGLDEVNTLLNSRPYADTKSELKSFINENIKK